MELPFLPLYLEHHFMSLNIPPWYVYYMAVPWLLPFKNYSCYSM